MLGVEDVSNEFGVDVGVSLGNIFSTGSVWNRIGLHVLRVSNHLCSTLHFIFSVERGLGAVRLVQLVENDRHGLAVSDVGAEVLDLQLIMSSLVAVEVDPADENLLGLKLQDISDFFIALLESPDLVAVLQVNVFDGKEFAGLSEDGEDGGGSEF